MVTANVTSWAAAQRYIMDSTDDILLIQESKSNQSQVHDCRTAAKTAGYNGKAAA